MRRVNGWEHRLVAYIAERRETPFAWGSQDCCRFACGGLAVQGLPDPMKGVRAYKTARGAAGAIRRLGGTLDEAATRLGARARLNEVAPAFAQRGSVVLADIAVGDLPVLADVATAETEVLPALGLVGLDGVALFAGHDGLVSRPLSTCRRAWNFS